MTGMPEWATVSSIEPSPFDAADRLRRRRRASARRHAAVPVQDHRLRQDLDAPRRHTSAGRLPARRSRGSCTARAAVSRHRARRDVSRPTTARPGSRSSSTCRPWRCTISSSRATTWSSRTHGRSIWILDDLQPIRESNETIASSAGCTCFPAADAVRWRGGGGSWAAAAPRFPNPPNGASIYYFLKDKPKGELKIEILDSARSHRPDAQQRCRASPTTAAKTTTRRT